MSDTPFPAGRRPRIWAIGISTLGAVYRDLAAEYQSRADIRLVTQRFDAALDEIKRAGRDEIDVIVAAGASGAYLRSHIALPIALVSVTGFDAMHALAHARRLSERIALLSHGEELADFKRFKAAFSLDIPHLSYRSAQEAEDAVYELRDSGVEVIVGPGLVTELAQRAGLTGIFLYSHSSVRAAFDTALEVARAARIEVARRERLDAILRHLSDGVLATDRNGLIQSLNANMVSILATEAGTALGKRLADLAPALALGFDPHEDAETVRTMGGKTYAIHHVPIIEQGDVTGALLTFQESQNLQRIDRSLRSRHRPTHLAARHQLDDLLGASPAIAGVRALAADYARSDATVLVLGESGTGKELLAQGMHNASGRREFPFVAMNCGAFPESLLESELFGYEEGAFTGARRGGKPGLIETAHRGTLFLDEIGEMPLLLQTRLLRVLQEREVVRLGANAATRVDVRVIAATHRDLGAMIAARTFREDLYYRLNILNLRLPPLRERGADVPAIAAVLLARAFARAAGGPPAEFTHLAQPEGATVTTAAAAAVTAVSAVTVVTAAAAANALLEPWHALLERYHWPGNVRELENVMERIAIAATATPPAAPVVDAARLRALAPEIFAQALQSRHEQESVHIPQLLHRAGRREEIETIRRVLADCGGDKDEACRRLGISRSTLWRRMRDDA